MSFLVCELIFIYIDMSLGIWIAADHGTFMLFGFLTVNKLEKAMKEMGIEMVFVAGDLSYAGIDADMPRANITSADEVIVLNRRMKDNTTVCIEGGRGSYV